MVSEQIIIVSAVLIEDRNMNVTNEDDKIAMRVLGKDEVVEVNKELTRKDKGKILLSFMCLNFVVAFTVYYVYEYSKSLPLAFALVLSAIILVSLFETVIEVIM